MSGLKAMAAMSVNLLVFMPLHTTINYQCATGANLADSVRELAKEGSLRFYAGFIWVAPIALVKRFIETFSLKRATQVLSLQHERYAIIASAFCAALSAALFQFLSMPFETLKTCSQVRGGWQNVKDRILARGVLSILDGTLAAVGAAFLASITFWGTHNVLDSNMSPWEFQLLRSGLIGFVSSVLTDLIVNVLRVTKVQLQSQGAKQKPGAFACPAHRDMKQSQTATQEPGANACPEHHRGMKLRILVRAVEGFMFLAMWQGSPAAHISARHGNSLLAVTSEAFLAKRFMEASAAFLEASECFDLKATGIRGHYHKPPPGETWLDDFEGCPDHGGVSDASKFVKQHLQEMSLESELELTSQIAELEFPGSGVFGLKAAASTAGHAIARNVATLFAARQASLALRSLGTAAAKERREIFSLQGKLEQALATLPWFYFGGGRDEKTPGSAKRQRWQMAKDVEFELRSRLKDSMTHELLEASSRHVLNFDFPTLAAAFKLPQKNHVRVGASGMMTKESRLRLGQDQNGNPLDMPMLGLGTGFQDCINGRELKYENKEGEKEVARLTKQECHPYGPHGWTSTVSLVDTAALYGTEAMVGQALNKSSHSRNDYFVMTKLPTRAMWPLLQINRGIDYLEHQLEDLQMPYVDMLMLHHDDFNRSEWNSLEDALSRGKTRAIGVSGIDTAWAVHRCVQEGACKQRAAIAEQVVSPCNAEDQPGELPPMGTSIVATSAVWTCLWEPHVASIAQRKGVKPVAVGVRWAMQTGAPVLMQTQGRKHWHDDLSALDFHLEEKEMALLHILSTLYLLNGEPNIPVLKAMSEPVSQTNGQQ